MNFEYLNFKSILNNHEGSSQEDICFVFYEGQLIVKSNANEINIPKREEIKELGVEEQNIEKIMNLLSIEGNKDEKSHLS